MGIQPIDLQTMYSQLSNVSKSMAGSQQSQLTEAMQQQTNIQRSLEKSSKVQETKTEKSDTSSVNKDGRGGSSAFGNSRKDAKSENGDASYGREGDAPDKKSSSPYLGTIIDITR